MADNPAPRTTHDTYWGDPARRDEPTPPPGNTFPHRATLERFLLAASEHSAAHNELGRAEGAGAPTGPAMRRLEAAALALTAARHDLQVAYGERWRQSVVDAPQPTDLARDISAGCGALGSKERLRMADASKQAGDFEPWPELPERVEIIAAVNPNGLATLLTQDDYTAQVRLDADGRVYFCHKNVLRPCGGLMDGNPKLGVVSEDRDARLDEAASLHALAAHRRADASHFRKLAVETDEEAERIEAKAHAMFASIPEAPGSGA